MKGQQFPQTPYTLMEIFPERVEVQRVRDASWLCMWNLFFNALKVCWSVDWHPGLISQLARTLDSQSDAERLRLSAGDGPHRMTSVTLTAAMKGQLHINTYRLRLGCYRSSNFWKSSAHKESSRTGT